MPSADDRTQVITATVNRYLELVATGTSHDLVTFYADDATLEDPVGGEVHIGTESIRRFYSAVDGTQRESELLQLRVCGNEAAFLFALTVRFADGGMRIEPIEVMVFDDTGKVTSMKAYWSPENVTSL